MISTSASLSSRVIRCWIQFFGPLRDLFLVSIGLIFFGILEARGATEDLTYEDLLEKLHSQKNRAVEQSRPHPFDQIKIHAGFGLNTSLMYQPAAQPSGSSSRDFSKAAQGFQMSLGIDLLDPQWSSEFALRNFGASYWRNQGTEFIKEWNLKVVYRNHPLGPVSQRWGVGFGTQQVRFESQEAPRTSGTSNYPFLIFLGGVDFWLTDIVSSGLELSLKPSLSSQPGGERSLADLMVRTDVHF